MKKPVIAIISILVLVVGISFILLSDTDKQIDVYESANGKVTI